MNKLVDVHAHLHHAAFSGDVEAAIARARTAGLAAIVENGLDPRSNRQVLALADRHELIRPALGIYPLNAAASLLQHWDATHRPEPFDVAEELRFIEANAGRLLAIGECGLDGYWAPETLDAQREVFVELVRLALRLDLPLIVHSRSRERECIELLEKEGALRVDLHCFGGKVADAVRAAENGWTLSVPPVLVRSTSFQALSRRLGPGSVLTETDCPYQGPRKDQRNEPAFVSETVTKLAEESGTERAAGGGRGRAELRAAVPSQIGLKRCPSPWIGSRGDRVCPRKRKAGHALARSAGWSARSGSPARGVDASKRCDRTVAVKTLPEGSAGLLDE